MTFPALKETSEKLVAKRDQLGAIFAEAGPEMDLSQVKSLDGDTAAKAEAIRNLNDELTDLGSEYDRLHAIQKAADNVKGMESKGFDPETGAPATAAAVKSLGDLFTESDAYKLKAGSNGPESHLDVDLKTLFTSSAGWAPETTRGPRLVLSAQRPIQMIDVVPQTTTNQTAITYMEETTFTNAAAEVAEGGTKPEAALELTEKSSAVRKIAVWLPVTDEQFEDVPRLREYINNRLTFMVQQRLDQQLISGNGTAPNLRGILNVAGIQTQAKGADPVPDAIYKACTKVKVTGQAMPNAVVMHPNDWQDVRLLRTADGIYIWGNPSEAGPARIWGLDVVEVQAATENTAVVGDFRNFSELAVKSGMDVQVSNSHSTYFVENKQAIRAEMRAAFVVYRPAAFCSVTGI